MSRRAESPMKNGVPFPIRPIRDQQGSPGAVHDPEYWSGPAMHDGFAGPSPFGVLSPPGAPPATLIVPEASKETVPTGSEIPVPVHGWAAGTVTVVDDNVVAEAALVGTSRASSNAPAVLRLAHRWNDKPLILIPP